ncbi:MAG: hypothetical protein ACOC0D_09560 [Spirochaeta sp.]
MKYHRFLIIFLVTVIFTPLQLSSEPLSAVELSRMILESEADLSSPERTDTSGEFARYDDAGFPETESGRLVVDNEPYGPVVRLRGNDLPYLLYAQYTNEQRDAVILARDADFDDLLPDGDSFTVPFGFGAVKMNIVDVSQVESLAVPHFSDNRKTYLTFPLFDLYGGIVTGSDGFGANVRAVFRERYTVNAGAAYSSVWAFADGHLMRAPITTISTGGGFRFPGIFPDLIGPNLITLGGNFAFRIRGKSIGGGMDFIPGAFVEMERVFFDSTPKNQDPGLISRPYNYRVHSVYIRLTEHLNPAAIGSRDPFSTGISIGYRVNFLGPQIPDHEVKNTRFVYVADEFRQDLQTQADRRRQRQELTPKPPESN